MNFQEPKPVYGEKMQEEMRAYERVEECSYESQENVYEHEKKTSADKYTPELLRIRYEGFMTYVESCLLAKKTTGVNFRMPGFPEDISENFVKYVIHRNGDTTSTWGCKKGDLHSEIEGRQEVKCFRSNGPLSFTPSSDWEVIYFMDARDYLDNHFTVYRANIKRTSDKWSAIKANKTETFGEHAAAGRRPRLIWKSLNAQLDDCLEMVYEGSFEEVFTPATA
jgi:hypothetical protein